MCPTFSIFNKFIFSLSSGELEDSIAIREEASKTDPILASLGEELSLQVERFPDMSLQERIPLLILWMDLMNKEILGNIIKPLFKQILM